MPKAKKKAVAKMKEKVEPTYYTTLTEEQFDKLNSKISWDNPLNELYEISSNGDSTQLELGFKLGEVHQKFENFLAELKEVMESIEPQSDDEEDFDWDNEEDFEEEDN